MVSAASITTSIASDRRQRPLVDRAQAQAPCGPGHHDQHCERPSARRTRPGSDTAGELPPEAAGSSDRSPAQPAQWVGAIIMCWTARPEASSSPTTDAGLVWVG